MGSQRTWTLTILSGVAVTSLFASSLRAQLPAEATARAPATRPEDGGTEIVYQTVDGMPLRLDLHLPAMEKGPPLRAGAASPHDSVPCVIFIHGGGWKNGDRKSGQKNYRWLTDHGFAVASIDYRLTDVARWPAQIDDCYAAVRWIGEHGREHGIDPKRIGVWGTSAGGHLAALVGTRPDRDSGDTSPRVRAVCDWFGPTDLLTMPPNNVGEGRTAEDVANSNGAKLFGATVRDVPELARDASALFNVSSDDAAFLIVHGEQDPGVPLSQSSRLHAALTDAGVPSRLLVVPEAGHGGKEFRGESVRTHVRRFFDRTLRGNWPQGPGPDGNFRLRGEAAPTRWSVAGDKNIRWRKRVPETGQSAVVTWGDRIYFTTMKEVQADSTLGSDIVAWCCDANSGETIWTREIAGPHPLRLSGCFGDSSSPSPVTDGLHICFFNASGRLATFDVDGNQVWQKNWMPVGRTQPVLVDGSVVFIKQTYPPDAGGNFTHEFKNAPRDQWTQLQAIDLQTGRPRWSTECGVNMGCVPLPMTLRDGRRVMAVGRGGGHSPPETPEGISLIDLRDGKTLWTLPIPKFMSTMTLNAVKDRLLAFDRGDHLWVDALTGKVTRRVSFTSEVPVRSHQPSGWVTNTRTVDLGKKSRAIIQQSNVVAGDYHYFRSYRQPWLGRVDLRSGKVECLQLPVQVSPGENPAGAGRPIWGIDDMDPKVVAELKKGLKKRETTLPIEKWCVAVNAMTNSRGFEVMGDARSRGNGWGHHASQVPTVVGDCLYVPTMTGTVYVIRWAAETLDENALVAINDLGVPGESWTRASLTFGDNKLFAHTIREVICIQANE